MKYYADNYTCDARVYNDQGQLVALVEKTESYHCLQDNLRLAGLLRDGESLIIYSYAQPALSVHGISGTGA